VRHWFVQGKACNVSKAEQVKALAAYAQQQLGSIDLWINNAGTNAYKYGPLLESDDDDLEAIVDTNILGVMLCCKEVSAKLQRQHNKFKL
jgi:chlorophyll(ide) b reductase